MKLSISDYKKILKFYKLSIPKKSINIRKKAEKIIAKKFCSCIKKVQQKFKKEGIAIGICTKSVITRKGYKRGSFKCKKRRTIKLQKGGKRRKKRTRKKKGGFNWFFQRDGVVLSNKPKRKSIYGEPHPLRFLLVDPRDNDDFDEDRTDGFSISFPFWGGKRRKKRTRKKKGGDLELKQIHVNDLNQHAVGKYFKFTTRSNTGVIQAFDGKFLGYRLDRGILKAIFRIIKPRGELYVRLGQFVEIFEYVAETDTDNHTLEFIFANPQQGGRRKKKSRKKRGGVMDEKDLIVGRIYQKDLSQGVTTEPGYAKIVGFGDSSGYKWIEAKLGTETNNLHNRKVNKIQRDIFIKLYKPYEFTPNTSQQDGAGKRRKKTRKKRGGTANLCKLFFEQNNGNVPLDTDHTVINKYCKDHGDTNIPPNDNNVCQASTGNCWLPTNIQPRRLLRVNRRGNNQGSRRSSIASTSLAPGRLTRQQGGGSKKDINQERFKLIKMEAKKLLDNNKEIIKKIEKKHNINILKNSKAIKKILDKTTLKDILKFKEKLMKIQKGGTRENEQDVSCAICLEDFTNERTPIPRQEWRFPCNHYRNHCIDCLPDFAFSGFDPNKIVTCPLCRAPLTTTFMERRNMDLQTLRDNIYLSDVVFVVGYCVITYLNQTGSDGFVGRTLWQIFFTFFLMFIGGSVRHDREIWRRRAERRRQTIEAINNNPQLNELLLQGRDADAERAREMLALYANQQQQEGGKLDYMWDNMHDHFLGVGNGIENTLNNLSKLKYDSSEKDKDRIETKKALLDLSNEIKNIKENQIEWGKIIKDTTLSRDNLRQKLETLQSSEKAKYRWPDYSETTNGSPPRPTIEQADIINTKIKELLQPHQQHAKFRIKSQRYKKNRTKIKRATKKKMSKGYGQRLGIILEGGKHRRKTRKKRGGNKYF